MFGNSRRRGRRQQAYPQLTRSTANPNASTAAAAAFMASSNQNPNRALSSAAAAAALRARPHTPTNVSEVQTKRTSRRSPSVSSIGSSASVAARRSTQLPLERKSSSGSMRDRTFRTPSPHGERRPFEQDHPPVPAIPAGHRMTKSASSAGVGMQNFKTASQKMEAGFPSWYTQPQGDTSNVRTTDAPMRAGRPESITSNAQRPDSRSSSVNFSYPGRSRAQSPPASPIFDQHPQQSDSPRRDSRRTERYSTGSSTTSKPDQTLVYDPNSRRMVPKSTLEDVSYKVKTASERPVKSKKNQAGVARSGSHLAKGTVARPRGTMVEDSEVPHDLPERGQSPGILSTNGMQVPQNHEPATTEPQYAQERTEDFAGANESYDSRLSTPSPVPQESQRLRSPRPGGPMNRKPSMVKEEPEDLETEAIPNSSKEVYGALDNVPTRQTIYESINEQDTIADSVLAPQGPSEDWNQSGNAVAAVSRGTPKNKPVAGLVSDDTAPQRSLSQSPIRQARFAPTPSDNLVVRHTPMPRSASPIKSALKHSSPSPRDISPSDHSTSDVARARFSSPEREAPVPRKKSARVSFDERSPVIVGESQGAPADTDSPIIASPQTRKPWYSSIGRNKKKETTPELEDDEVMKPRPALPMFGSVREKKTRESEEQERPLIRPHDISNSAPTPASPVLQPSNPQATSDLRASTEHSSDHVVGSVLSQAQSQDLASRNPANISRFREPLPPVVTSVEGNGDLSDSLKSSEDEAGVFETAGDDSEEEDVPGTQLTIPESQVNSLNGSTILEAKHPGVPERSLAQGVVPVSTSQSPTGLSELPAIQLTQPSPAPMDENMTLSKQLGEQAFGIPGMFPEDDSDDNQASNQHHEHHATPAPVLSSTAEAMKEPEAAIVPSQVHTLPQTTLATTRQPTQPENTTDDESNASIYSDAYEDISDEEGDGFQSLNAVVESPVTKPSQPQQVLEDGAFSRAHPAEAQSVSQKDTTPTRASMGTLPQNDWEQAKSFWRGLTTEKRRQLELEAMEDAGAEGDHEELQTPTRKLSNRTKKTPEQRQATAVAQAVQAQAAAPTEHSKSMRRSDPERTYMIQPGSRANHGPISPARSSGHMRMSMREEPPQQTKSGPVAKSVPGDVHLRKSMRANGGANNNASRRISSQPERIASSQTNTRPRTAGAQDGRPSQHAKAVSLDVTASAAAAFARPAKPAPQRRDSDASDSSFKRARAAPSEGSHFRRSMRQDRQDPAPTRPQSPPEVTRGSGRFSLRSLSPTGSTFRRQSTGAPPVTGGMRRSLRSGSESSKDSKRPSMQFPGFGRTTGKPAVKRTKAGSSRFEDSSDEDEPTSKFRSRFDNSSDEEDVRPSSASRPLSKGTLRGSTTAPAPFKNITTPVLEEAEDSPDLPDSDDEPSMQMPSPLRSPGNASSFRPPLGQRPSSGIGTSTLQRSGQGTLSNSVTATATARPGSERRSSFMSNILRRNKKADGAARITRPELMDSPARRDTKLERTNDELKGLRGNMRPTSPKLQKRNTFTGPDSWPLPEAAENGRPSTAGGAVNGGGAKRPDFVGRRSTSLGIPEVPQLNGHDLGVETAIDGPDPAKKKKKFGALRRMFRLDD